MDYYTAVTLQLEATITIGIIELTMWAMSQI